MFLKSINEATLLPLDALTFAEIAGRVGFDGVEFRVERIEECFERGKLEDLVKILDRYEMKDISLNAVEDFSLLPESRFQRLVEKVEFLCNICKRIDCGMLIAVPSPLPGSKTLQEGFIIKRTSDALESLATLAFKHGIKIGFEFLGFSNCSVNNLRDAWRIVDSLGLENLGLVIDTFHFYVGDCSTEDLKKIPGNKVFLVHVNDAPAIRRNELTDRHRILPGKGAIPLADFFDGLRKINYGGHLSVELFNERYWAMNASFVAKEAFDSLERLFKFREE